MKNKKRELLFDTIKKEATIYMENNGFSVKDRNTFIVGISKDDIEPDKVKHDIIDFLSNLEGLNLKKVLKLCRVTCFGKSCYIAFKLETE